MIGRLIRVAAGGAAAVGLSWLATSGAPATPFTPTP